MMSYVERDRDRDRDHYWNVDYSGFSSDSGLNSFSNYSG